MKVKAEGEEQRVQELEAELAALRQRLEENEETIRAIRSGEVDAFVVEFQDGQRVYSLRGSEEVYHAFVDRMRDGAVTVSQDNTVMYANRRFIELIGVPRSKVIGKSLLDHVTPEDAYLATALVQRARLREGTVEVALVRGGSTIPVSIFAFPVDLDGVRVVSVLLTDLTEIHRYRDDLERMVEARTTELSEQARNLESVSAAKNELIARLAVELEKPVRDTQEVVSDLKPVAASLRDGETVEVSRGHLALIENSLIRLSSLLQDTRALSEIESGEARLAYAVVHLRSLALDAVEQARASISQKGVEIALDVPQDDVSFVGDGEKVRQVVVALLLLCAESVETGAVRLAVDVTPDLGARFTACAPGHRLPLEQIEGILAGSLDSEVIRNMSDTVPALSIWTMMRSAQFMHGRILTEREATHDCIAFSLPL